jgi:hypothetical protein
VGPGLPRVAYRCVSGDLPFIYVPNIFIAQAEFNHTPFWLKPPEKIFDCLAGEKNINEIIQTLFTDKNFIDALTEEPKNL